MWELVALIVVAVLIICIVCCYMKPTVVVVRPAEKFSAEMGGFKFGVDPEQVAHSLADTAEAAKNGVATFSNTLQRRMGMGSAGGGGTDKFSSNNCVGTFDCRDKFQDRSVSYNMTAGDYH